MKKMLILFFVSLISIHPNFAQKTDKYTDYRDGKVYKTVQIGNQLWMAENIKFNAEEGCVSYNYSDSLSNIYGLLYTYETAMNVCPDEWHLPSKEEWNELIIHIGDDNAGTHLKKESELWYSKNLLADNSSGFSALPGGQKFPDDINEGAFAYMSFYALFWTSGSNSEESSTITIYTNEEEAEKDKNKVKEKTKNAWLIELIYDKKDIYQMNLRTDYYASVRCLKNN